MKIALCLFNYFPHGGLQRDFMGVLNELLRRKHTVTVFCQQWQADIDPRFELVIIPCKGSNHRRANQFSQAIEAIHQQAQHDVILGFNRMAGLDFYYAADMPFAGKLLQKPWLKWLPRYRHYLALEEKVFSPTSATRIFSLNPKIKQQYQMLYQKADNYFIDIVPWVPKPILSLSKAEARQKLPFQSPKKWTLLFVGTFLEVKGLDRALQALACLPADIKDQCQLWIIGSKKQAKFEALAAQLHLSQQVRFLGNQDQIYLFMQAADVMIHPAKQELGGLVLLEALVNALPVITTSNCGFAHYIEEANMGWVIPGKPFSQAMLNRTLAKALSEDLAHPSWQQRSQHYLAHHDFTQMPSIIADHLEPFRG